VFQGTAYDGEATTQTSTLPANGHGFITSLEGGYPIPLPLGAGFILEPQMQLIWQRVDFSARSDGTEPIDPGTTTGLTGRIGVRGQWTIERTDGEVWQPYARANLWRDWGGDATTLFGSDAVPLAEEATRLELAAGVTAKISRRMSLYA
jgi:outer membrane autotransporter protein